MHHNKKQINDTFLVVAVVEIFKGWQKYRHKNHNVCFQVPYQALLYTQTAHTQLTIKVFCDSNSPPVNHLLVVLTLTGNLASVTALK